MLFLQSCSLQIEVLRELFLGRSWNLVFCFDAGATYAELCDPRLGKAKEAA